MNMYLTNELFHHGKFPNIYEKQVFLNIFNPQDSDKNQKRTHKYLPKKVTLKKIKETKTRKLTSLLIQDFVCENNFKF